MYIKHKLCLIKILNPGSQYGGGDFAHPSSPGGFNSF